MSLLEKLVIAALPAVPRPLMRRFSARYIAGETLAEALAELESLKARGFAGVVDVLGEEVTEEAEARAAQAEYKRAAQQQAERGLDSYVSVKPTHLGMRVSTELAYELYADLAEHCGALGESVRVEMEDHTTTDDTLALFARLRARYDNVTIVLQSRLLRTPRDIDDLGGEPLDVRMVKGIYLEPPEIAHTSPQAIRDAFVECTERLFERGHTVALATHDDQVVARVRDVARERGIPSERYYIEVLLGVRRRLWAHWQETGTRVRVYVPYGPEWRSYSQRRLRKNPQLLRHVVRNLVGS